MSNGLEQQRHNKSGESGFYYFYGVVEDRKDPEKLGRVRVRIFNDHTEKLSELPTEDLIWSQVILPVTASPNSSHNLLDGQLVFGYYADGIDKSVPIIMGSVMMNGETTVDPEGKKEEGFQDQRIKKDCNLGKPNLWSSTGVNTSPTICSDNYHKSYIKSLKDKHKFNKMGYSEPTSENTIKYPFNISQQFESGHIIEYDNTPGNERIVITHRTGSYIEMNKDGSIIIKSINELHSISNNSSFDAVGNNYSRVVSNTVNDSVGGSYILKVSGGNLDVNVSGNVNYNVGGSFNVKASKINLN